MFGLERLEYILLGKYESHKCLEMEEFDLLQIAHVSLNLSSPRHLPYVPVFLSIVCEMTT